MVSFRSVVSTLVTGGVLVVGGGAAFSAMSSGPGPDRAEVVRVVDGDTIEVRYDGEERLVRFLNVDTPETKHPGKAVECLGPEATAYLQGQLEPGDTVRLEFDQELLDRYGRELAGVFEDGLLINAEIARRGLGIPVYFEPNRKFLDEVTAAYEEAKAAEAGMFSPSLTCTFEARISQYADSVAQVEAAATADPSTAQDAADTVVAEGTALLAIIAGAEAGSLAAAGLTAAELETMRVHVVELQNRASGAGEAAAAEVERVKAEAEAKKKAEEEAKKKADEAKKKAEEEAKRKAEEEAQRKAEEEARAAAEEAQRQAEEQAAAEAEAARRAQEQQNNQIQPLMPQQPAAPAPAPAPAPQANWSYENCTAARAAGAAPVYVGQPGYGTHLDRDRDGVGCE